MKSKLLLSVLLMFCAISANYAQSSLTQSGIAIQGIARDVNNTALTNQTISLKYTLYYLDANKAAKYIYVVTKNTTTDNFGVFSDVIEAAATNNFLFSNNAAFLKIEKGTEIISDEQLRHVPYAISANNGVPTGSIMPFMGTAAPFGWALCDGNPLPGSATDLIAMVGSNTPNLQGMFLRGTGTAGTGQTGPALKTVQQDGLESHNHSASVIDPGHIHSVKDYYYTDNGSPTIPSGIAGKGDNDSVKNYTSGFDKNLSAEKSSTGISVNIGNTGITETRPVNYGVNYIIKL